jgi:hypothetical protein
LTLTPVVVAKATTNLPEVATMPPRSKTLSGAITVSNSKYSAAVGVDAAAIAKLTATGKPFVLFIETLNTVGVAPTV